ncbi:cysteine-rich DPF motif domain-containing protein 1 isoform 2-T3 [Liasis olivaceus]
MESKQDTFECELCGLTAPYSYYGQQPPNAYSVTLLEDCYVMKDPFTHEKDRILILGAQCSLCHKRVCVGPLETSHRSDGCDVVSHSRGSENLDEVFPLKPN